VTLAAGASSSKNNDTTQPQVLTTDDSPLLLRVLPFIISSGFLCKWEYFSPVITCISIHRIWVEDQHSLPASALVDIRTESNRTRFVTSYPLWATRKGLENIIPSPKFGRTVFEKLCELKVAVKTTERKKQKIRDALSKVRYSCSGDCIL
jgi:malate/lactate dehydrogenase